MTDQACILSPQTVRDIEVWDLSDYTPDQLDELFLGSLKSSDKKWHRTLLIKAFFGTLQISKKRRRYFWVGTWDPITSPMRFHVHDLKYVDKITGWIPTTVHVDAGLECLQLILGQKRAASLLEDHENSMTGIALQILKADMENLEDARANMRSNRSSLGATPDQPLPLYTARADTAGDAEDGEHELAATG